MIIALIGLILIVFLIFVPKVARWMLHILTFISVVFIFIGWYLEKQDVEGVVLLMIIGLISIPILAILYAILYLRNKYWPKNKVIR